MSNEDIHRNVPIDFDPLRPHAHDPNPAPPTDNPTFTLLLPNETSHCVTVDVLASLPVVTLNNCFIVSTGHGTSGPFRFTGPTLYSLVRYYTYAESFHATSPTAEIDQNFSEKLYLDDGELSWSQVEVISADGFGTRIDVAELQQLDSAEQIILAYTIDGQPMTREQGLVRLIVPSERDDALRQVKWLETINVR